MAELMVSVSGIRGIVGEALNPETILKYVSGYAEYINGKKIVIGRDSRKTGNFISSLVENILISKGYEVYDLGIVPTPTVLLNVEILKADGGIIITASHNPIEWNALKLCSSKGMFLTKKEGKDFLETAENNNFTYKKYDKIGKKVEYKKGIENHTSKILKNVDLELIKEKKFKVVLDCVNGAGGVFTPGLLGRLNCDFTVLNKEPNGDFPRNPEPRPKYLNALADKVKKTNADIGFAHDPDVDRLCIVDNNGEPLSEEYTLTLASWAKLERENGLVVCNLSTSRMIDDIADKYNSKVLRTAVGEVNVAQEMKNKNAVIGGEGNGGVIFPEIHFTRDAPAAIALILEFLAKKEKKISELIKEIPEYIMIKDKVHFDSLKKRSKIMKKYYEIEYEDVLNVNDEDGIRFDWNQGWVHVRPSGTEPIIRIIGESTDRKWLKSKIKEMKEYV